MKSTSEVRVDKWLWSVRIFKTRSLATEACKKGKVLINKMVVKPSKFIKPDDLIDVHKNRIVYTYKVKSLLSNRVSANLVSDFLIDLTSPEELEKQKLFHRENDMFFRPKGKGRPTKKDRRSMDNHLFS